MVEVLIIATPAKNDMVINDIKLTNYRNHSNYITSFEPQTNLIIGPNGSGKTNILESIHLLATTKSYRAKYDKEVIKHDETFAKIEAGVDDISLEIIIMADPKYENMSHKKLRANKVAKSASNFTSYIYTVLFSPEEIEIFKASPSKRRHYIDMILFQIDRNYKKNHSEYTKALRQRNKLLELISLGRNEMGQMAFWDEKIIELAGEIHQRRSDLFDYIKTKVYSKGKEMNGGTELILKYKKSELNQNRLGIYREKELAAKATLIGPHRDDFEISADGYDLASFGSRGQQRTAVLALKLSEIDFITEITSQKPILLLDDIFSELDEIHRETVLETIGNQQTIVTSTEDIPYLGSYKVIHLK